MSKYTDNKYPHIVHIYCLIDPVTNEIFYIGKTRCEVMQRLHLHDTAARKNRGTRTASRIKEILDNGLHPKIKNLLNVSSTEWRKVERQVIQYFLDHGYELTNTSKGGGGG